MGSGKYHSVSCSDPRLMYYNYQGTVLIAHRGLVSMLINGLVCLGTECNMIADSLPHAHAAHGTAATAGRAWEDPGLWDLRLVSVKAEYRRLGVFSQPATPPVWTMRILPFLSIPTRSERSSISKDRS